MESRLRTKEIGEALDRDPLADVGNRLGFSLSAEVTGDGTEQSTAHNLGYAPGMALAIFTELPANLAGGADWAAGTHDDTNCAFTVTTGIKYRVLAF